jgi:hypothetical protein
MIINLLFLRNIKNLDCFHSENIKNIIKTLFKKCFIFLLFSF